MMMLYETAFSDFKVEALFTPNDDVLDEPYNLYVKPNFTTACWTWAPPHRIFLGDKVLERIKPECTVADKVEYLKKYLWHEYAHACFTERDFERTTAELKRIRAPFPVYNRFEDIRIEHRARQRWDKFKFEWSKYEVLKPVKGSNARDADGILFLLTQLEGDVSKVKLLVSDLALFDEVLPFYLEACACRTSLALMPVIDRWIRKFPQAKEDAGQAPGGMGDLPFSAALSLVPGALDEFMSDVREAGELEDDGEFEQDSLPEYHPDQDASRDAQQGTVLGTRPSRINEEDVASATEMLAQLYAPRHTRVSAEFGKRVSIRHHLIGRGPYRRMEVSGKRRKKVGLVVDCSGSMDGFHIQQGRVLVKALSNLAVLGAVEGYVILSKVSAAGPVWERFKLPMSDEAIARIVADGHAEGIAPTLYANKTVATELDLLMVLSDGNIRDVPLDKKWLHSLGVFTLGVYIGKAGEAAAHLKRYFDNVVVRPTVKDFVQDLLLTL